MVAEVRDIAPHGVNTIVEVSPAVNAAIDAEVLARHGSVAVYADDGGADDGAAGASLDGAERPLAVRAGLHRPRRPGGPRAGGRRPAVLDGAVRVGAEAGLPLHHYPLDRAAEAHAAVEGGTVGKVLIDVRP